MTVACSHQTDAASPARLTRTSDPVVTASPNPTNTRLVRYVAGLQADSGPRSIPSRIMRPVATRQIPVMDKRRSIQTFSTRRRISHRTDVVITAIGVTRTIACSNVRRHSRKGPAKTVPTTTPVTIPAMTSVTKCDPRQTRLIATHVARPYPIQAVRGQCRASTVATANVAEVWPDGNESSPDSKEGHNCHPPEWVRRGLGRPIRCLRPLTTSATQPCAKRLSIPACSQSFRPASHPTANRHRLTATNDAPFPTFSPRSPSRCTEERSRERKNRSRGTSSCINAAQQAPTVRNDKAAATRDVSAEEAHESVPASCVARPAPGSLMAPNRRERH